MDKKASTNIAREITAEDETLIMCDLALDIFVDGDLKFSPQVIGQNERLIPVNGGHRFMRGKLQPQIKMR
jgi:hypothetical protein